MARLPRLAATPVAMILVAALLSGCVTSKKYRLAKADTPPAQPLGWTVAAPPAELTLVTLIVFKGPGSWKREARWDEYAVRIGNRGPQPFVIESAALIDPLGVAQVPGEDPWRLEKLSSTNWERYGKTGLNLALGAGAAVLVGATAQAAALNAVWAGPAAGGVALFTTVIPVAFLVDVGAVAVMNSQNKSKVAAEFTRRRLAFPAEVAPGAARDGSLFFPMTPSPRRLVLRVRTGEERAEVSLLLPQLAGLHLNGETPPR